VKRLRDHLGTSSDTIGLSAMSNVTGDTNLAVYSDLVSRAVKLARSFSEFLTLSEADQVCVCVCVCVFVCMYTENTKGGGITVPLTYSLTGLDYSVLQIKTQWYSDTFPFSIPCLSSLAYYAKVFVTAQESCVTLVPV